MTRRRRGIVALLLSAALATCSTDQTPTGPGRGGRAYLALQPSFKGVATPSAFGFTIDGVRAAVIRPPSDTVADTTVFFNPDSSSIRLALSVDLKTSPEIFNLLLQLRAGAQLLYSGVEQRQVFAGPSTTPPTDTIALTYVGPGAGITHINIAPKDSVLTLSGTKQYRVTADSSGVPVTSFFVRWSSSDSLQARIDSLGILHAPAVRGSVLVRATTPTNVRDSTPVTFIPVPTGVAVASGGGQTGVVATRLPLPLRVQVVASDAQGVKGIAVRFRALSGGSVRDSVVTTDAGGFASDSVTLGTVAGSQLYEASVSSLKPDTITVTASPGAISAAQSVVSVSNTPVLSGAAATLTLQAKDAFGNGLTTGGAAVAFTATGGTSTGSIGPTTDNHNGTYTTTFTGVVAGTATTIGATINGTAVSTTLPTLTVTPGAISATTSLVSVSSPSVASGTSVTLTLQAKDAAGNSLSTGGATVAFTTNGGTSTGAIGTTTDHANGTYTATFTGIAAGTATSIGAAINGTPVTTGLPTLSVIAGAISATTSVVTVTSGTVASGASATLTLQAKDAVGNSLTTGGATVSFSASGGTSTGTIGAITDHGNGTYSAIFTGVVAGTATTVGAKVNGSATVSTTSIMVVPGNAVTAQSIITVSASTLASGGVDTLALQARDSVGNPITKGGLIVVFTSSGGTSTGTISAAIDHGNGTYTATFTAVLAGTATTIGATIGGSPVTSTLPTVTVSAGAIAPATSIVTVSSGTVASGLTLTFTLQAKDAAGNALSTGGATVVFTATGGTSSGTIGATTDHANGTYTANFTAVLAGSATTIGATINTTAVTTTLPTVTVTPGAISPAKSVLTVTASTVLQGAIDTLLLQARDAAGNTLTSGGALVVFTQNGGTSVGSISAATDLGNGTYRGLFTGTTIGTPTTIGATINGVAVTSTPLPTIQVTATVHSVDIAADSTWTVALSPHVVNGYLRILNGATLTIQPGAVVKFNAGAGLQVGDTVLNQAGGLVLDGTGPGITLTANTATPTPGFWKGIEVQRNLGLTTWRRTLVEWAGGTRTPFGALASEACILFVNRSGAEVDLDSVRIRQCVHAGVHHFGGTSHIRRSEVDSVTGSGIHADLDATLQLDSNTVRGSGQEGLLLGSPATHLAPSRLNRFVGNATFGIQLQAVQLPGLLRQDSIAGNATDFIAVTGGQPDPTVAAFTIFAQPQRSGSNGYVINGLLDVGRTGGQTVTLDSNLVLRFRSQSGLLIGDSAGTRSGSIVSLGMNRTNAPRLTSANPSPAPGDWYGLEIGRLSTNTRLANLRIEFAGDSIPGRSKHRFGLNIHSPAAQTLAVDSMVVAQSGRVGSDTNSAGIGVLASGGGVDIRRSVTQGNLGYGFALAGVPNVKAVGDTARSNTVGFALFADAGVSAVAPGDSVASNVATGNTLYPLSLDIRRLPVLFPNSFTGNGRDTLLLDGHRITFTDTLPHFPGLPWRVTHAPIQIDSGGSLTLAAGDTLAFDNGTAILVGQSLPAALRVPGTGTLPVLLTATPGQPSWLGLFFQNLSQADTLANVIVEKAGRFVPPPLNCGIDLVCPTSLFGSIRFTNSSSFGLLLDTVTVRNSVAYAVEALPSGTGTVTIRHGQFYANPALFHASSGVALTVTQSDIYHYGKVVIVNNSSTPGDSVAATNNWWGDVLGPDTGSVGADSLGRATTGRQAVRTTPFATSSFISVGGPATALVTTRDSLSPALSTSALIGVRAVDGSGRGVPGVSITWSAPSGTSITPLSGAGDGGGRFMSQWQFFTSAGRKVATATGSGLPPVQFVANVKPGSTVSENWTLLSALSQGTVSGQRAITFTSTNRRGVIVTFAHDSFGNSTQPSPSSICAAAPGQACPFVFPPYAQIDSTHTSGGSNGDTIFFHANVTSPSPFVLRATYVGPNASLMFDSITIAMSPVIGGVRIDHDPNTPGIQAVPDTVRIHSLCPTGPGNASCSTTYTASLVDSGGTALPPGNASFIWHLVPPAGPITLDSMNVFPHDIAYVTARSNGFIRLAVKDTSGNNFGTDTLPILVQQLPSIVRVTPDTVSVPVGGTTAFRGTVVDSGGDTMTTLPVHWRNDNTSNPHVTIIDTSVANQVTVRLDSTPFGSENITAFAIGGPGDTAYGIGQVVNPLVLRLSVGLAPWAIAANSQTHAVFVGHQGGQLYQLDGTTEARVDSVAAGKFVSAVAVNPITNRVYAGTDLGVAVYDGTALSPIGLVSAGTNQLGISNLQGLTVDSVNNRIYVAVDIGSAAPAPVLRRIDGSTNTFSASNDVSLPGHGTGAAFDPVNGLVYVAIPDSNFVVAVDPVAKTFTRIPAGTTPTYVAVNPVTNRVYVANTSSDDITVIDASSGSVLTTITVFNTPGSIAVDAVNNRIYVGTSGVPYLILINGTTNVLFTTFLVGNPSTDTELGVTFDAGNQKLWTANNASSSVSRLKY